MEQPEQVTAPDIMALAHRVMERCDVLGSCSEETFRLTRRFLTPPMREVHEHVGGWMIAAGLSPRIDAVGNILGHRAGTSTSAPSFVIGSHLDTVPHAGKYDGIVGVLLGIAVAEALRDAELPFGLLVAGFSEEEGVRYGAPFLGSMAAAGSFERSLLQLTDADGVSMDQAIRDFGGDPDRIAQAAWVPERLLGYLEAHIEQGPVLESLNLPIGIVTGIAGQTRAQVLFEGRAAHAGTVPPDQRRDALTGAAEFILAVEAHARATPDLRATVGTVNIGPNVSNVIPGRAMLGLDIRHADDQLRQAAVDHLLEVARQIGEARRLAVTLKTNATQSVVRCDPKLTRIMQEAVAEAGIRPSHLLSGAGHDAMVISRILPTAMLFLRCRDGVSHHPDESVKVEDVAAALDAMARFVSSLPKKLISAV